MDVDTEPFEELTLVIKFKSYKEAIRLFTTVVEKMKVPVEDLPEDHPSYADFNKDPNVSVEEFFGKIFKEVRVSDLTIVVSLFYLNRVLLYNPLLTISYLNVLRISTIALLIASELVGNEDLTYEDWVELCDCEHWTEEKMKTMRSEFLLLLRNNLAVETERLNGFFSFCCRTMNEE